MPAISEDFLLQLSFIIFPIFVLQGLI